MARSEPRQRTTTGHPAPGETSSLAIRAVSASAAGATGRDFLARRLAAQVAALEPGGERSVVNHVACLLEDRTAEDPPGPAALAAGLVRYAGVLERDGRLDEAATVLDSADTLAPGAPETALHAARVERKRGARERALALYRTVRQRSETSGTLARMAAVGEAMLAADPVSSLGRVLRESVGAGDREAAAVAQEERARARRASGDRAGALRDYLVSAARFADPVDRGRLLHEAADMLSARGDLLAARELLLAALDEGRREQRDHAANRLHTLARALGDEIGRRRWAGAHPAGLVSLTPARPGGAASPAPTTLASRVERWLDRLRTLRSVPPSRTPGATAAPDRLIGH